MKKKRMQKRFLIFMYVLAFVLLREWLLPVMELTDTGHMDLLLGFVIIAFGFSLFGVTPFISIPVKLLYIAWAVHYIYLDVVWFTLRTATILFQNLASNFTLIVQGDWENITDPFRTVLFFILLWMTTYLIRHWVETKKSIFLFYMTTVLYVTLLDTFTPYSANGSIFTIMLTGLSLLGLLTIMRIYGQDGTRFTLRDLLSVAAPLFLLVMVSGVIANLLPEKDPVWPDPVPYLKTFVGGTLDEGDERGVAKSGYGPDDSRLGGPFLEDDTLVFEAVVEKKQYWKVETKNTYTTKGWEQVSVGNTPYEFYRPRMVMDGGDSQPGVERGPVGTAKLKMVEKFPFLVYPYGMTKAITDQNVTILHLSESGQYRTTVGEEEAFLDFYELEYVDHSYSLQALRATRMESYNLSGENFDEYLQLPEELPTRIGELAETITASSESVYDKAKAIERYFASNGFAYDQQNVAVPGEDEDYVDQFLFETKRGYCDNFSTSMVVMLRTLDIPARWAKGFAPGDTVNYADGEQIYQVTNKEAHSWVEAYMPGIGWMPFEPTIGFNGPADIDYDLEMKADDPEIPEMPKKERDRLEQKKAEGEKKEAWTLNVTKAFETVGQSIRENKMILFILFALLALVSGGLYAIRKKWMPKVIISMSRSKIDDWETYANRYRILLKQLDRSGLERESGETLNAYAARVDGHFGSDRMKQLTAVYEEGLYGGNKTGHDWARLQKMWEDFMNGTTD